MLSIVMLSAIMLNVVDNESSVIWDCSCQAAYAGIILLF
jgi:hypothetical protein